MSSLVTTLFGGTPSQPDPNPSINRATDASLALGMRAENRADEQFAWAKDLGQKQLALSQKVTDSDLSIAKQNQDQAVQQWQRYNTLFAPVEDKMVSDATNYDSPDQQARVRQEAAGNANEAFDTAQASRSLGLEHMGVNPNSGRFADPTAMSLARAGAVAGSENEATANLRDKAIGLRAGAASLGRGLPNTAAQAYGLSTNAGNSAVGNSNATAASVVANTGNPTAWTGTGLSGYNTAGNIGNSMYSNQIRGYAAHNDVMLREAGLQYGIGKDIGKSFGMT